VFVFDYCGFVYWFGSSFDVGVYICLLVVLGWLVCSLF